MACHERCHCDADNDMDLSDFPFDIDDVAVQFTVRTAEPDAALCLQGTSVC